jgi:hypothetical protein
VTSLSGVKAGDKLTGDRFESLGKPRHIAGQVGGLSDPDEQVGRDETPAESRSFDGSRSCYVSRLSQSLIIPTRG